MSVIIRRLRALVEASNTPEGRGQFTAVNGDEAAKLLAALGAGQIIRDSLQEYMDGAKEEGGQVDERDVQAVKAWDSAMKDEPIDES